MSELHDIHELHSTQESEKGEQPKPLPPVMTPASREIMVVREIRPSWPSSRPSTFPIALSLHSTSI